MSDRCRHFLALLLCFASGMAWSAGVQVADSPLAQARQLVLVRAADWSSTSGTLQLFHRSETSFAWQPFGAPVKVSLGRNGLAWGRGRHGSLAAQGPVKREGDGRAPAGVFDLTMLFGYLEPRSLAVRTARMPYLEATPDLLCVDDAASSRYNRIIHRSQQGVQDWKSHEDMLRPDGLYAWGAFIAHNTEPAQPAAGSCIFLHVWEAEGVPTSGCTAGAATDIARIFLWLESKASPVIVQLPESEYTSLQKQWNLP
ncbi:MAG: hypothetical protein H6R01_1769 [Burkholderiaceae bacterium]|nr:hypothetical protein [Burkholderiaceae bacterium]